MHRPVPHRVLSVLLLGLLTAAALGCAQGSVLQDDQERASPWKVHEMDRSAPPVIMPPEQDLSAPPPERAVVLFDLDAGNRPTGLTFHLEGAAMPATKAE